MPLRPMSRAAGVVLLLFVLLMRERSPRQGELWVDVLDAGAARSAIVSTANHRLLFGSGEAFGSQGRRFEERVARPLLENGDGAADAFIVGRLNSDSLRAVVAADALLGVELVVRNAGGAGPPEIVACTARSWQWDGVGFELSPGPSGKSCVLIVHAGTRRIVLTQEEMDADPADWMLLPRSARKQQASQIQSLLRDGGVAVASTDKREWQTSRWRELRQELEGKGIIVHSTSDDGTLRFAFTEAHGIRMRDSPGLHPGIWMRLPRDHSCAIGL